LIQRCARFAATGSRTAGPEQYSLNPPFKQQSLSADIDIFIS
jgi:hypothetical protein